MWSEVGLSQTFSTNEIRDFETQWLQALVYYTHPYTTRKQCGMRSLVVASHSSLDSKVPMFCECIHLRAMGSSTYGGQCLCCKIDIMWQCLLYRVVVVVDDEASFCELYNYARGPLMDIASYSTKSKRCVQFDLLKDYVRNNVYIKLVCIDSMWTLILPNHETWIENSKYE